MKSDRPRCEFKATHPRPDDHRYARFLAETPTGWAPACPRCAEGLVGLGRRVFWLGARVTVRDTVRP